METDDIFSDDDSCFSLTSVEISELKDMRRGWKNRASAMGTDETIIIDAESDLNLQENEELLDDNEEDDAKPPKGMSIVHKLIFKKEACILLNLTGKMHIMKMRTCYNHKVNYT